MNGIISKRAVTQADISPAIKSAVNAVLMAHCVVEVEREKMDKIDREILQVAYFTSEQWAPRMPRHRITEPKENYLMNDEDAKDYFAERQKRINAMGYKLPDGHCPALVAESVLSDARRILIEVSVPVWGINPHQLLCAGMDKYHKYIDLICGLVVNLPGFKSPVKELA